MIKIKFCLIINLLYWSCSLLLIYIFLKLLLNKGKNHQYDEQNEEINLFGDIADNNTKYIIPKFPSNKQCGGLGNQLYRFASLYGIGKKIGRRPAFLLDKGCEEGETHGFENESYASMKEIFPIYAKHVNFITINKDETDYVDDYGTHCCKFDSPAHLSSYKKKFLLTAGFEFHTFKYFHKHADDIRLMFSFSEELIDRTKQIHNHLFRNDHSHKICVHTRRGDFIKYKYESKKKFTVHATKYVYKSLKKSNANVSIILMGADKDFLLDVKDELLNIQHIYMPERLPRHLDICFAVHSCNSLLITASASTYAWWIGYLMGERAKIYYNADFKHTNFTSAEHFPKEWKPLSFD